ncbi:MAG: metal ABC transporter permease, partial [Candidatus Bipolaricaulota bacterium]
CSAAGAFVVRLKLSSLGFAMSHAAFAGAALGLWIGLVDPVWTALLFALVAAAALGPLADLSRLEVDSILGGVFPLTMALGLIFIHQVSGPGFGGALSLLWGSVLGITWGEVTVLAGTALALAVIMLGWRHGFLALLLDRKLAEASGFATRRYFYTVLFLTALVVSVSLRISGGLVIYALTVLPATAALQWVYDVRKVFIVAMAIGVSAAVGGFALSLGADLPIGSSIAVCAAGVFLVSLALSPKRRRGVARCHEA